MVKKGENVVRIGMVLCCMCLVLSACSKEPTGFDKMNLMSGETGLVPLSATANPPADEDIVSWERKGQSVIAYNRVRLACPQHASRSMSGVIFKPDRIVLCYDLLLDSPGQETTFYGQCPQDLLVQYEVVGLPQGVDPRFELIRGCGNVTP